MTFEELLSARADDIVGRFLTALAQQGESGRLRADDAAEILHELQGDLARAPLRAAREGGAESGRDPTPHDVPSLVRAYGALRHAILSSASASRVALTNEQFDAVGRLFDRYLVAAAAKYADRRDAEVSAQQEKLEFLARAGEILSASLDYRSTLSRVTRLVVPRLADACAVHLADVSVEDMPIAHVDPAKAELLRELYRCCPPGQDLLHGHGAALRSDASRLVPRIDAAELPSVAHGPEHLALLRRVNISSYLVVPLHVAEHVFGALTLIHSDSGRRYSENDLVLATDLARRAALAIDNARLYQLSQRERSRVEAATRAKDDFVAMISHELRTPLNAILGWVRLMRGGNLSEDKREHAFAVIERNANAQHQLVSDLLDISRAMTGRIRIQPSQVDLSNIVDVALEDARLALDAKRIEVQATLDRERSLLRGDAERLQQVVWKLLSNAIKFTPKGGQIFVTLARQESDLVLTVQDTGIGIAPSFLPHVFESFRQSEAGASRAHGGLGVGLSITKHLVDLHGGSIDVQSEGAGKGATFVVRLPISPLVSSTMGVPQVPATRETLPAFELPAVSRGLRVLVVDDEPDARELIGYVLETCGMEVRLAGTAAAALAELDAYAPDVIISDIGMPEQDGYALIRNIRTLPSTEKKDIPAIALTAFTRNEDRTRALVAGFNLHLGKPVEPTALVHAVLELAGRANTEPPPSVH